MNQNGLFSPQFAAGEVRRTAILHPLSPKDIHAKLTKIVFFLHHFHGREAPGWAALTRRRQPLHFDQNCLVFPHFQAWQISIRVASSLSLQIYQNWLFFHPFHTKEAVVSYPTSSSRPSYVSSSLQINQKSPFSPHKFNASKTPTDCRPY